jgi:hypothetical protein
MSVHLAAGLLLVPVELPCAADAHTQSKHPGGDRQGSHVNLVCCLPPCNTLTHVYMSV